MIVSTPSGRSSTKPAWATSSASRSTASASGLPGLELLAAEQHVVAHRLREQRRVLEGHADVLAQLGQLEVADVDAVDRDATLGHVVQARGQRRERRLARTGEADERHRLARAQHEVDAVEQIALAGRGIRIPEVHALERELAARARRSSRGCRGRRSCSPRRTPRRCGRSRCARRAVNENRKPIDSIGQRSTVAIAKNAMSSAVCSCPTLDEVDAGAEAQRERDVGQQHEPEPDPADRAGLAQLGLRAASRPGW